MENELKQHYPWEKNHIAVPQLGTGIIIQEKIPRGDSNKGMGHQIVRQYRAAIGIRHQ